MTLAEANNQSLAPLERHKRKPNLLVLHNSKDLRILTGSSNPELAQKVSNILNVECCQPISYFPDGEVNVGVDISVRRKDVFIIQPTSPPHVNDYHMELCLMLDAVFRASPKEITAITTYLGYSRQDRQDDQNRINAKRNPISSKVIIDQIFAYANRIVSFDIHAEQETGMSTKPFDILNASSALVPIIAKQIDANNTVAMSPDFGGAKRAKKIGGFLGIKNVAVAYKERKNGSEVETNKLLGDVQDKDVLLIDDVLSTGSSLKAGALLARHLGARRILVSVTHGLFIGEKDQVVNTLVEAGIERIFVTDTVKQRPEIIAHPAIEMVSVAPLIAEAIKKIVKGQSIHSLSLS